MEREMRRGMRTGLKYAEAAMAAVSLAVPGCAGRGTGNTGPGKAKPAGNSRFQTAQRQNRHPRTRFRGYGRESERTGQATEKQMWRGRLRERWRNYHPRGSKRKSVDYSPGQ